VLMSFFMRVRERGAEANPGWNARMAFFPEDWLAPYVWKVLAFGRRRSPWGTSFRALISAGFSQATR